MRHVEVGDLSILTTRTWLLAGAILALVLTSFLAEPVPSSAECSGPCAFGSVALTEEASTVDVSVALQLSAAVPKIEVAVDQASVVVRVLATSTEEQVPEVPVALGTVESDAPPPPTTAAGSPVDASVETPVETLPLVDRGLSVDVDPPATVPEKCIVGVVAEADLRGPTSTAFEALNALMPEMRLVLADTGPITISYGGEWPVEQPPLGWTDPTRRTILINPDHPASMIDAALADMIVHELGHVLISVVHVHDGTILDPRLDGQIRVGSADRDALGASSCAALGL